MARELDARETWWQAVIDCQAVQGDALMIALVVSTQARRDGHRALVSTQMLVDATGLSESTVRRRLRELRSAGWLTRARRGHRLGNGKPVASMWSLSVPASTGQPVTQVNGSGTTSTAHLSDHKRKPQPVKRAVSTGQRVASTGHPGEQLPQVPTEPSPQDISSEELPEANASGTAQTLVAEWIDHCGDRPPGRVIGQVARELGAMLAEGIPYADVRGGLGQWHGKGLHPSTLPSEVHNFRTRQHRTAGAQRPSTADQRVAEGLALVKHFHDLEQHQQQRALPPGATA